MTKDKGKKLSHFLIIKENQYLPLSECVVTVLEKYFEQLDGYPAAGLYAIILAEVEAPLLKITLDHVNGNQSRAAEILGLSRSTLRKKLRLYDLNVT